MLCSKQKYVPWSHLFLDGSWGAIISACAPPSKKTLLHLFGHHSPLWKSSAFVFIGSHLALNRSDDSEKLLRIKSLKCDISGQLPCVSSQIHCKVNSHIPLGKQKTLEILSRSVNSCKGRMLAWWRADTCNLSNMLNHTAAWFLILFQAFNFHLVILSVNWLIGPWDCDSNLIANGLLATITSTFILFFQQAALAISSQHQLIYQPPSL